jgi:hypothetical protein
MPVAISGAPHEGAGFDHEIAAGAFARAPTSGSATVKEHDEGSHLGRLDPRAIGLAFARRW